jgi:hypothetical protein
VAQNKEMKLFRMPSDYSRGDIALLIRIGSIFLDDLYFRRGQRLPAEKTSEMRPSATRRQVQDCFVPVYKTVQLCKPYTFRHVFKSFCVTRVLIIAATIPTTRGIRPTPTRSIIMKCIMRTNAPFLLLM